MGAGGRRKSFAVVLAGMGVAALAATPLVSSAALGDGFKVRAVNSSDSSFSAIRGIGGAESPIAAPSTPATEAPTSSAPEPVDLITTMTIDTSMSGCNAGEFNLTSNYIKEQPNSATVSWGDGSPSAKFNSGYNGHSYSSAGVYELKIDGKIGALNGGGENCIKSIDHFGADSGLLSLEELFKNNRNIASVAAPPATVTNTSDMFYGSSFNGDTSNWTLPGLKVADRMFRGAYNFKGELSNLETGNLESTVSMFEFASAFNGDLSSWNVSKLNRADSMFAYASSFNGDLSSWKPTSMRTMFSMFSGASKFQGGDLRGWNMPELTSTAFMFQDATSFTGDISTWDMRKVVSTEGMFYGASKFNGDISSWKTPLNYSMNYMFLNANSFTGDLSGWDVTSVEMHNSTGLSDERSPEYKS